MTINIVRLDRWIDPCFDQMLQAQPFVNLSVIKTDSSIEDNLALMAQADIYHTTASRAETPSHWHVTQQTVAHWPRLKVVSSAGAGYDTIDVDVCTNAGILLVNQAGGNANSVAEHALGMMLALMHRISESDKVLRQRQSHIPARESLMGHELNGLTLGLIGVGSIGRRVAQLAKVFGLKVLAYDPYLTPEEIQLRGATSVSMAQLLKESDMISLHCPRNDETVNLFGAEQFATMKKGAAFVSTARGGIHDEGALYDALVSGHLSGAGLDVWQVEPPPTDHPLLTLNNVIATFHTAGVTHEARRNIAMIAAQQLLEICHGNRPPRMINPQVYEDVITKFSGLR